MQEATADMQEATADMQEATADMQEATADSRGPQNARGYRRYARGYRRYEEATADSGTRAATAVDTSYNTIINNEGNIIKNKKKIKVYMIMLYI